METRKRKSENSLSGNVLLSDHKDKENIPQFWPKDFQLNTPKKASKLLEEPVTPSTNFKLLTSLAATLDYANCLTPKSSKKASVLNSPLPLDLDASETVTGKVNRKEKSLAIICTRFLTMYPVYPPPDKNIIVSLDEAGSNLGVERRRLYDIVNVFESIEILTKTAKNQYLWFGKTNLVHSLQKLKAAAKKENILEKLQYVMKNEYTSIYKQSCMLNEVQNFMNLESSDSPFPVAMLVDVKKEKSLGIMSQKFLMLFLVSPEKIISLGVAAKVLNGFNQVQEGGSQVKTQIRRLYDIANVLSSIGLIQKEVSHQGRKPAFKYIGPDLEKCQDDSVVLNTSKTMYSKQGVKSRSLARHSSFQEICAVAEMERQKLNLKEKSQNSAQSFEHKIKEPETSKINFSCINFDQSATNSSKTNGVVDKGLQQQSILKPHLKVINFTRSVDMNVPNQCYILTGLKSDKDAANCKGTGGSQTYLLINTAGCSPKELKVEAPQNQTNKVSSPQTIPISLEQRDAILKSLNITLSPEQMATIHLHGSSSITESRNISSNVLTITNKSNSQKELNNRSVSALQKNIDSCYASVESLQNNSNSMQVKGSPINIPSGYATPISSSSADISFVPTYEVNDFLRKIEDRTDPKGFDDKLSNKKEQSVDDNSYSQVSSLNKATNNNMPISNKIACAQNQTSISVSNDSCSNDSTNLEIARIFKGKELGDVSLKTKPFLIDEKTILSPLKKRPNVSQVTVPSHLMTPPYIVPDTVFVFTTPPPNTNVNTPRPCIIVPNSVLKDEDTLQ